MGPEAVGASGDYLDRARALVEAKVDLLVLDSSHAHSKGVLDATAALREAFPDTALMVGNVASAAQCDARGGWYYDVAPPATPSKITLCPQSCEPLKATENSTVQVLYGCKTKPPA